MGGVRTHKSSQLDLYEKTHNLYLYLPANSNHPKGNMKGLVYGSLYRIHRLTSNPLTRQQHIQNLYTRVLARGYNKKELLIAIADANKRYGTQYNHSSTDSEPNKQKAEIDNICFFHIPYHPSDPTSNIIQDSFRREIQFPRGLTPLHNLKNHKNTDLGINRLIVAYHRPPNISNLLSPRTMTAANGPAVSSYLD
jgi:hypothetical protein